MGYALKATAVCKETYSGRMVNLLNPDINDIDLFDIAWSLSNTIRFNGHGTEQYTVAQHSSFVGSLLPLELRIYGLAHDMPEAYVGDAATPYKMAMRARCPSYDEAARSIEESFAVLIYKKLGVPPPSADIQAEVRKADLIALATEQRDIMHSLNDWGLPHPPVQEKITAINSKWARHGLISDFHKLGINITRGAQRHHAR